MSSSSSVGIPATLNPITGPNSGSSSEVMTHGTPGVAIFCTTSRSASSGASRSVSDSHAARSDASVRRSTRTPLTPPWWRSIGAVDFSTTG